MYIEYLLFIFVAWLSHVILQQLGVFGQTVEQFKEWWCHCVLCTNERFYYLLLILVMHVINILNPSSLKHCVLPRADFPMFSICLSQNLFFCDHSCLYVHYSNLPVASPEQDFQSHHRNAVSKFIPCPRSVISNVQTPNLRNLSKNTPSKSL
jgi:hypothetical protein